MNIPTSPLAVLPLALGLIIFSFLITAIAIVPFIDFLYKLKFTRRVEGVGGKAKSLFDKLHDKKAGTPIGGGILVIIIVTVLFVTLLPLAARMGLFIQSSFELSKELFVIVFSFVSFGLLGLLDDAIKIFGKPKPGALGSVFGLTKKQKFVMQWVLAGAIGYYLYAYMGIQILHIPLINITLHLGWLYAPFAAFVIIFFTNAFNFTDGLDGLASGLLMIFLFAYIVITGTATLDTPLFMFIGLWLGSLIAFLYFNTWPARIWMGDAGALSFGAMIAVVGLITGNILATFVIGGLFVIEAASSLLQIASYKLFKKRLFPLAPIHHTFLALGWEEPKIVIRAWLAGIMLAIFGLWISSI
jgi:phospho-N-acetylmuramoyl-pentapeptide-transferase